MDKYTTVAKEKVEALKSCTLTKQAVLNQIRQSNKTAWAVSEMKKDIQVLKHSMKCVI